MSSETLGDALTEPRTDECPLCYVERMLDAFGCDNTLRWTLRWRDRRRPKAADLERRLESAGVRCDCRSLHRPLAIDRALGCRAPHGGGR